MKKKILVILILVIIICCILLIRINVRKNSRSGYENIIYSGLKTYTEITNIKEIKSSEEVGKMKYTYQINNKEDKNINKYKEYLTDEYGFTFNSEKSNEKTEYYDYKGSSIIFEIEKQNDDIYLIIYIPLSEDYLEKNIEKKYNEAIECIDKEEYRGARNILYAIRNAENYNDYKDSKKAIAYANGMLYKKSNVYGSAIEAFNSASDYKDANSQKEELKKIVLKYEGTWYYDDPKMPGKGHGHYIFIKDGKVSLSYESSYKNGVSASYTNSLAMKHNDENSLNEIFITFSLAGIDKDIEEKDYEYLLTELPDGGLAVGATKSNTNGYHTGVYDKISNDTPN